MSKEQKIIQALSNYLLDPQNNEARCEVFNALDLPRENFGRPTQEQRDFVLQTIRNIVKDGEPTIRAFVNIKLSFLNENTNAIAILDQDILIKVGKILNRTDFKAGFLCRTN